MKMSLLVLALLSLTTYVSAQVAWGDNTLGQCDVPANNPCIAVAAGDYHSLGLKYDRSLLAWGNNGDGQCNVPAGNDYVRIAANYNYNIALKNNGSLVAWGDNEYGQCNVPAGNDFKAIATGVFHGLAIRTDGSLVTWGNVNPEANDIPAGNDFTAISAGLDYSLALRADHSIVAWGLLRDGLEDVPAGNDFTAISAGRDYALALKSDHSIVAWGSNAHGTLDVPQGNDFIEIAAGGAHCVATTTVHRLVCWGNNANGQCEAPSDPISYYSAIAAGSLHSICLSAIPVEIGGEWITITANYFVQLSWVTETEWNQAGFNLYRSDNNDYDQSTRINTDLIPATNTSEQHTYTFLDTEVATYSTYYYWLEFVYQDGGSDLFGPGTITMPGDPPPVPPPPSSMSMAYPNPAEAGNLQCITCYIKGGENGIITVYDLKGQIIKTASYGAGWHSMRLGTKDLGSGVYFYRLVTPTCKVTRKAVIVK